MMFSVSFQHDDVTSDGLSRLSAHYYWMFTIRPAECQVFNAVFDRLGNSERAIRFLAERYPFGLPLEATGNLTDDDLALLSRMEIDRKDTFDEEVPSPSLTSPLPSPSKVSAAASPRDGSDACSFGSRQAVTVPAAVATLPALPVHS